MDKTCTVDLFQYKFGSNLSQKSATQCLLQEQKLLWSLLETWGRTKIRNLKWLAIRGQSPYRKNRAAQEQETTCDRLDRYQMEGLGSKNQSSKKHPYHRYKHMISEFL